MLAQSSSKYRGLPEAMWSFNVAIHAQQMMPNKAVMLFGRSFLGRPMPYQRVFDKTLIYAANCGH